MDGDGATERVWLEAAGQLDAECIANGAGTGVLAGVISGGNGLSVTHRRIDRGSRVDAVVWTGGLRHWRLLPLSMLYYYRFALWPALHDAGSAVSSPDGLGDAGSADDGDEYHSDAGNACWNQYFRDRKSLSPALSKGRGRANWRRWQHQPNSKPINRRR